MEPVFQWLIAGIAAVLGPLMTIFDMPGNTLMFLTGIGLVFFCEDISLEINSLLIMAIVYVVGECWEFVVSLFGIRKEKVSWLAVFLIGCGGFIGTLVGTGFFPILGSFLGGVIGAFIAAFIYEYLHTGGSKDAWHLAWVAAKMRFLALLGKLTAGMVLAVMLVKIIILR